MAKVALAVIRPVVNVGSRIAPGLAGRIAFDVFCRPGAATARDARQRDAMSAAQKRLEAAERITLSTAHGFVETYRFAAPSPPARGAVLLVHGWTGRAAFMQGFVPALLKEGFEVLALDLPGHGLSSGKRLNMPLAMEALAVARRAHGPFHGIIGHSFGGAVAIAAAAGVVPAYRALDVKRIVTVAAPDRMSTYFNAFGGAIGLSGAAQTVMNDRVQSIAATTLDRFDGRARLRDMPVPTLVVHDRNDREIPFSDAESMASAGLHVRLLATEGLGHRRILQSLAVARAAAAHMAGRMTVDNYASAASPSSL
jgi:pimeloyl-ACP methyl ester carboxylesterase